MAFVYILFSEKDDGWYIGSTKLSVEDRFSYHNRGSVKSTKYRKPLLLAYYEECKTNSNARKREWHLKHPKGYKEKLMITKILEADTLSWPRRGPFGIRAPDLS